MSKKISLLQPDVRNFYINTGAGRPTTAKGLVVESDYQLESDIKQGGTIFSNVKEYIDKNIESRYIMINTDCQEFAEMAVAYLHADYLAHDVLYADDWNDEYNYNDYLEYEDGRMIDSWEENSHLIPMIDGFEASSVLGNDYGGADSGNCERMVQLFENSVDNRKPFWVDCCREAVCLLYYDPCFILGDKLKNVLDYFSHNKRVYIIRLHNSDESSSDDLFFDMNTTTEWDWVILDYNIDQVFVEKSKLDLSKYYKNIFKSVIANQNLNVKKGFSYDNIIKLLLAMRNEQKCKLIDKIVKYAVKHKTDGDSKPLMNQDFEFLRGFAKSEAIASDDKTSIKVLESELVGMESVKQQVKNIVQVMKFNQFRQSMNIERGTFHNVHMMLGAPGTAKTTVAKLMGRMMMEEQLLPGNRLICVNGAELKGMYVGHSAPKTKRIFEENDIIVIDEAYSLVDSNGQNDSFAQEAIAQMITEMEEHSVDKLIIFAGYGGKKVDEKDNRMRDFLNANPGIKSRINSTIYFDSYTSEQMADIFYTIAKVQTYTVPEEARKDIVKYFETRVLADNFGNGREARSLLEMSTLYTAKRIMQKDKSKITKADLQTIVLEDIKKAIKDAENQIDVRDCTYDTKKVGF